MSSRKRPLAELPPNVHSLTPSRYAPSTPHAICALQQRSGAKTRSARTKRITKETVRPESARGILRRLAKITAPSTRRTTRTPVVVSGKENEEPDDDEDDEHDYKKPRMTFDIEESIEESIDEDAPQYEEEEDSELPAAPTPSMLPDDEDGNPTMTFKSIDFARQVQLASEKVDRRKSRVSMLPDVEVEGEDDDPTILTERGRRAISEEATGRLSRYSFGSLRMSDFGTELEIGRDIDGKSNSRTLEANDLAGRADSEPRIVLDDDTAFLRQSRRSLSEGPEEGGLFMPMVDEETFQLNMPEDDEEAGATHPLKQALPPPEIGIGSDDRDSALPFEQEPRLATSPEPDRRLTQLEEASRTTTTTTTRRRKRMKMTKHGTIVPSLPSGLIKHIATETQVRNGRRRPKLGKDHMNALEQATEWFFEQVGEDLAAYADHGRRKKRIDNSDVLLLMRRQRLLTEDGELERLAKDWLPKDVLSELDLPLKP